MCVNWNKCHVEIARKHAGDHIRVQITRLTSQQKTMQVCSDDNSDKVKAYSQDRQESGYI